MKRLELSTIQEYYEHVYLIHSLKHDRELLITASGDNLDTRRNRDGMSLSMYDCAIQGKECYIKAIGNMPNDSELKQSLQAFNEMCDFFEVSYIPGRGKIAQMFLKMIEYSSGMTLYVDMHKAVYEPWQFESNGFNFITKFKVTDDDELICMDRAFKIRAY